jgi:hypothetical protein
VRLNRSSGIPLPVTVSIDYSGERPMMMVIDADGTTTLARFFGDPTHA